LNDWNIETHRQERQNKSLEQRIARISTYARRLLMIEISRTLRKKPEDYIKNIQRKNLHFERDRYGGEKNERYVPLWNYRM